MKVLILGGGLGTRLGKYTKDIPKSMLPFGGISLLERQVNLYKKSGLDNITVIRKHLADKINISGVKYIDETDYSTHMVVGFFQAEKEFDDDDIILSYGDVLFERPVLDSVIKSEAEVGVVADMAWKKYWKERYGKINNDLESFVLGEKNKIISLGIPDPSLEDVHARYVGIIKFSRSVLTKMKKIYHTAAKESWEKPWHTSKSFKSAYMTDFIQELIDQGIDVRAIPIKNKWLEFDTIQDYELAIKWKEQGTLKRFLNLDNG